MHGESDSGCWNILLDYGISYPNHVENDAEVAELADAHDSKSCGVTRVSSILSFGTIFFWLIRFCLGSTLLKIATAILLIFTWRILQAEKFIKEL